MFTGLTKIMHDGREAGREYRRAVDRSIGLDQAKAHALADDVCRSRIR